MFRSTIIVSFLVVALCHAVSSVKTNREWYENVLVYQIYPRSFKDSNGDGIGDLNGIAGKLEHIADIGAAALWLSPIYTSPQVDFGYDIANFTDVDPDYGTLADFDKLVAKAKSLGLKVILDFVPNHSSNKHAWFEKSARKIKPYDEYYVWRDPKIINGTRQPPNNWICSFQNSAWEWNQIRGQYYLHQFAIGQPDLNYRSLALKEEMKNILTFWMNKGVDGFRIDAINVIFEDTLFRDEPKSNIPGVPSNDYDSLIHIHTKDLNETYELLNEWRVLMDDHSRKTNSETKMILTEANVTIDLIIEYYKAGSTVPFNFMFIADLTNKSTAADFKRLIDLWMDNIPSKENVANWVVGNHDNHRAASRLGVRRADQLNMLSTVLPGVSIVYNGDEIGMVDRPFTYEETKDIAGCNAGPERYHLKSRDPERTPFQWDNTTSAGFSTNPKTWLPVHDNYKTLNLAAQKVASTSHYKVFRALVALKMKNVIAEGSLQVTLVTEKVLGVVRKLGSSVVVLLVNFSDSQVTVDARTWLNVPERLIVYTASLGSNLRFGSIGNMASLRLPGAASAIYVTDDLVS